MRNIEKAMLVGAVSLLLSVCLHVTIVCEEFTGKVVGVADGDTITVMHQGWGEPIRLHGIDAPERGQPFTNRAKQFVSDLCYQKQVRVETKGQDRYQRTIADVILQDGRILNYEIVKAGLAWWLKRYAPKDPTLEGLEFQAREARRGLWVLRDPVPPWEFRRNKPAPYTEKE
jgi:micrococcal nuclease